MKIVFSLVLFFNISFIFCQLQIDTLPNVKPEMNKELYKNLKSYYSKAVKNINDSSKYWFEHRSDYWNIFLVNASLNDDSLSRIYWLKSFAKFPFWTCDSYYYYYSNNRTKLVNPYFYINLHRNSNFYDSCCQVYYKTLDSNLIKTLHQIDKDDQFYRLKIDEAISPELKKDYWKKQIYLDSINQIKIDSIFNKYGYPGRDLVGFDNENIMFLVFQHSNLEMMEKYLPFIKKEIAEHTLNPKIYAYLKDRINMIKGIPQIFGTQVTEVKPDKFELYKMRSMYKIDSLRASFNLGSLSKYLEKFRIKLEK